MKINSYNKARSSSNNSKNIQSNKHFKLGASLIFGPYFDIKKYLNNNFQQNSVKKEKGDLPPLFDSMNKRTRNSDKKYQLYTLDNDYSPNHRRNITQLKKPSNLDVSTTISYNNNSISKNNNNSFSLKSNNGKNSMLYNKLKLSKNRSSKAYLKTESDCHTIYLNKHLDNNEAFNLQNSIRNIKRNVTLSRTDKSIQNIMDNKVAYSNKNADIIFKPIRILNDFNNFQQHELNNNKTNISLFLTDNREISRRNVIIKVLENQEKNYRKNINNYQKSIDNAKKTIESDENDFDNYSFNQKMLCKGVDELLIKLTLSNRRLTNEFYLLRAGLRVKEDERQKLLERIEDLRIIAKFVTKVLEDDNMNIFKTKIIPDYSSEHLPNYELISKIVCERFNFLLDEDLENLKEDELLILNEINHLNDSEILYHQYYKIEYDIINTLKNKKAVEDEIVEIKKEGIKQSNDIQLRIEDLKKELEMNNKIYEREKKNYEDMIQGNNSGDNELDEYIRDLYYEVMYLEYHTFPKSKLVNIGKAVMDIKKLIIDKEDKINKFQMALEQYEIEDKHLFDRVACHRRNDNKELKVNIMKKMIAADQKEKLENFRIPEEKIIFIKRKVEAPYRPPKKEKIIKIDPEIIQQRENNELLTYE
jgi:hypothetical protein